MDIVDNPSLLSLHRKSWEFNVARVITMLEVRQKLTLVAMPVHLSYSSTAALPPSSLLSTTHVFNSYLAYIGPVKRDEPILSAISSGWSLSNPTPTGN